MLVVLALIAGGHRRSGVGDAHRPGRAGSPSARPSLVALLLIVGRPSRPRAAAPTSPSRRSSPVCASVSCTTTQRHPSSRLAARWPPSPPTPATRSTGSRVRCPGCWSGYGRRPAGHLAVALRPRPSRPDRRRTPLPTSSWSSSTTSPARAASAWTAPPLATDLDAALRDAHRLRPHDHLRRRRRTRRSVRSTGRGGRGPAALSEIGLSTVRTDARRGGRPAAQRPPDAGLLRARRRPAVDARARRACPGGRRRVRPAPRHRRALRRRPPARHVRGAQPHRPRDARRRGAGDRRAGLRRRRDRVDQRPRAETRELALRLRNEITRLVSEIRFSIFDLRHEVTDGRLAGALADYVPRGQPRAPASGSTCPSTSPARRCPRVARPSCCGWPRRPSATCASTPGPTTSGSRLVSDGSVLAPRDRGRRCRQRRARASATGDSRP